MDLIDIVAMKKDRKQNLKNTCQAFMFYNAYL
jgi:hypothetical protein